MRSIYGTEVFPIHNDRTHLKYKRRSMAEVLAGGEDEYIKEGDFISIIEKQYVTRLYDYFRPDDKKFFSRDDTKFKRGTVKSIAPFGATWRDEDGGSHQQVKIVLTNIDSAKEILNNRVIKNAFPTIEEFSEEHIVIGDGYEPSHYYSRGIVSGRLKRKRRTRKVKRSKKPPKNPPKNPPKKPPKKTPKNPPKKKPQ